MNTPAASVILRSCNQGWALKETLSALSAQRFRNWELIVIDSGSTDGSVELIRAAHPRHFIQIEPHEDHPARVMNHGVELADSNFCILLNADATPQGPDWLSPLVEALLVPQVAGVYGRQIPRPDCRAVYARDYERCFRPNRQSAVWRHFFSLTGIGVRKNVWLGQGFDLRTRYSDDDDWTHWAQLQGCQIMYVPESVVMCSRNYTPTQAWKRSFGEAYALAAVWPGRPSAFNWPRTVLFGWLNDAGRDLFYCFRRHRIYEWPFALRIRWQQRCAKLAGFKSGWLDHRGETGPQMLRA